MADIDLENREIFLRGFLSGYNIGDNILKVAFNDPTTPLVGSVSLLVGYFERWTRAKWAIKSLMEGFQEDLNSEEFKYFMMSLSSKFKQDSFISSILYWLLKIFEHPVTPSVMALFGNSQNQ